MNIDSALPQSAASRPIRGTALALFLALSFLYLSMSPGSIAGYGYNTEEMESGLRMMSIVTAVSKGRPVPPMLWSRHGPTPVLFDLPFLKIGKVFATPDLAMSFEPPLMTAALITILFLWLRRICSPSIAMFLTLAGAFGTMLWPYAYIGLETNQSMLILLAGYLGLARGKIQGWARVLGFAVLCGFAMTVKSTGVIVWPAIAYLFYAQFRDDWRQRWRLLLSSSVLIVLMCWINVVLRNFYWGPLGGGESQLRGWLIQSKFQVFTNLIGLFGSPSKGFFIFAPVLIAVLWAIPRAFRTNRDIVAFATLILVCTIGFLSILNYTTDETWGSRYLHIAVAPLLLCIGAAWPKFRWRVHLPLTALVCLGVVISFLGAFFPYGTRGAATDKAGQNTMEWLTGDNVWNEIVFDARLFQVWWHGGTDAVPWTPTHLWVWTPPKDAPTWKTVDLRELAEPQGALFYYWNKPRAPSIEKLTRFYLFSLVTGLLLLAGTVWVSVARAPGRHPLNMRLVKAAVLGVGLLVAAVAVGISMSRPKTPTLVVDKSEVVAGREAFTLKIAEMPNRKVIVRYSIDGGAPEEMGAALDAAGSVHFDVGADTRKGEYRLLAFKEQQDVFWVNSNVVIRVK